MEPEAFGELGLLVGARYPPARLPFHHLSCFGNSSALSDWGNQLKYKRLGLGDGLATLSPQNDRETQLIVYALLAAILMLIVLTAVSSLDVPKRRR